MKRVLITIVMLLLAPAARAELYGGGPRIHSGALLIAASDSSALDKANAWKICDGTTDQVEIQAAIDALSSGGTVFLAAGNYAIPADITMAADVTLAGTWASKLTSPASSDDSIITGTSVDGFVIRGLYLEGTTASNTLAAHIGLIHLNNCDNATIEGCYVVGSDGAGIAATESDWLEISGCTCIENADDGIEVFTGCADFKIIGNTLIDNSPDGTPNPSGNLKIRNDCPAGIITGNTCRTQYLNNVILFTSSSSDAMSLPSAFTGNTVINTHVDGSHLTGPGISLYGPDSDDTVRFWVITGNSISSADYYGIRFASWVEDCVISGNHITAYYGAGSLDTTCENISIIGNFFMQYPGSGGPYGIHLRGTNNNLMIANNIFADAATNGIKLTTTFVGTNCSIICNTFTGGIDAGINFDYTSESGATNQIYGNDFDGCDARYTDGTNNDADTIPSGWSNTILNSPDAGIAYGSNLRGVTKTLIRTINLDSSDDNDDAEFDDTQENVTEQPRNFGAIIPAYAGITSAQIRCIETVSESVAMSIDLGFTTGAADLLTTADIDTANDIKTSAAGTAPEMPLAATAAARNLWINATPGANWNTLTAGRWAVMVTYIDYAESHDARDP